MNRLDMAEEITERVPSLSEYYKEDWKAAERVRKEFVSDYPLSKIRSLSLDEYVIGKGSDNRSFCYRLEREMDILGRILGATAFKFGIYFGRTKTNAADKYRFSSIWGSNKKEVFTAIKNAIFNLLQDVDKGDMSAVAKNRLSPMFKGKILHIYRPDQFAPIYSEKHLEYFIANLNISGSFQSGAEMQRALMDYRKMWSELKEQPIPLYMRMLYDIFGHPANNNSGKGGTVKLPLLDDAVRGAEFIEHMPAISHKTTPLPSDIGATNHEKRQKQLKRIGDRGEAIVLALEKNRLIQSGKFKLARRIDPVSQQSDSIGYDILSFDEDGSERYIEVKSTASNNLDRGFYISSNELEKAKALGNYYIYFVFSAMSNKPKVLPMKHPALDGKDFILRPITYQVTVNINEEVI